MFFRAAAKGVEEDPIYRRVRDGITPREIAEREWIESLFRDTAPFLDLDLSQRVAKERSNPSSGFCRNVLRLCAQGERSHSG